MAEIVISGIIFAICALFMFGIGITQLKSKEPVGFYSGEEPPSKEQITDVKAWNIKHGIMWIIYGFCIVVSWLCGLIIGNSIYILIPYLIGLLVPIIFMIMYHHKLIRMYFIK